MKKILLLSMTSLAMLMADFTLIGEQLTPVSESTAPVVPTGAYTVVPGLYGFGTDTRAAYGGSVDPKILHVNTLDSGVSNTDSTHGTLEWALKEPYPRVIVFDVAGIIQHNPPTGSDYDIDIKNPYFTLAGQTAPGRIILQGNTSIRITGGGEALIQHITVRGTDAYGETNLNTSGISVSAWSGDVNNVVIDHCSVSWTSKGGIGVWSTYPQDGSAGGNSVNNITISNNIISEILYNHSTGSLINGNNVSIHNNLYAHNNNRHPFIKVGTSVAFYNNVVYNHTFRVAQFSGDYNYNGNGYAKLDFRGNNVVRGPNSASASYPLVSYMADFSDNYSYLYMKDNIKFGVTVLGEDTEGTPRNTDYFQDTTPVSVPNLTPYAASFTYDRVLANAGARPAYRCAVDTRVVNEVKNRQNTFNGSGKITTPPETISEQEIHKPFIPVENPHAMYNEYYTNLEHQLHQLAEIVETK